MKLYAIIINGKYYYNKEVFTNKERATRTVDDMNCFAGYEKYELKEFDLPFIGRSVCYVSGYYGFDYDFDRIYDIESITNIFACNDHAKKSKLWKKATADSNGNNDKFIITDTKIASKDLFGEEFIYGDCMEGMFNVSIERIRVNKK